MGLSNSLIGQLWRLIAGESVAASLLRKEIAEALLDEGLLTVRTQGSRRQFAAVNGAELKRFLESNYEEFRGTDVLEKSELTRASMAAATGNSKLVQVRSCPGFPVNSYETIRCQLNGCDFEVNPPEGSFVFVADWRQFQIPQDVVVVGIENMENFRMIRHQKYLFDLSGRILFVSRYPQSVDLRTWLSQIPNRYIHFGDFDLAGIHIFLTEFHRYLGNRASFLIPADIETRLQNGSSKRYNDQLASFKHLSTDIPEVQALIELIHTYHKGYDQEGYILLEEHLHV